MIERDTIGLFIEEEMEVEKSGRSGKITKKADKKEWHEPNWQLHAAASSGAYRMYVRIDDVCSI